MSLDPTTCFITLQNSDKKLHVRFGDLKWQKFFSLNIVCMLRRIFLLLCFKFLEIYRLWYVSLYISLTLQGVMFFAATAWFTSAMSSILIFQKTIPDLVQIWMMRREVVEENFAFTMIIVINVCDDVTFWRQVHWHLLCFLHHFIVFLMIFLFSVCSNKL